MATLFALPANLVPKAHTAFSVFAFSTALIAGYVSGLWEALCENAVSKWPVEWWPSVSATIGDHAAARAPFQILIALTATPRFLILALQWLAHRYPPRSATSRPLSAPSASLNSTTTVKRSLRSRSKHTDVIEKESVVHEDDELDSDVVLDTPSPTNGRKGQRRAGLVDLELCLGLARTVMCGGWMFITSRDQHDLHDLAMIVYMLLDAPWFYLSWAHSTNARAKRWRAICASGFFAMLPGLIYLFVQHNVKRVPGSYTYYAFFEWSLVAWDVAFDAATFFELDHFQIRVVDTSRAEIESDDKNGHISSNGIYLYPVPKRPIVEEDWTAKPSKRASPFPQPEIAAYLSDVWFATAWWTVFTGVSVQLFYWSVWSLAITGSELGITINLIPYLFSKPGYRAMMTSRDGVFWNRTLMYVLGLGCWAIPSVAARFFCVLGAMACGWNAVIANQLRTRGSPEAATQGRILMTGIVLCMLGKYLCYSNNPFWAIVDGSSGGWNKTGLLLSALSVAETYYRPNSLFAAPPTPASDRRPDPTFGTTRNQRLAIAFGLGSFVHLCQTFLSDSGTVLAWSWVGFPARGPLLHPWAGIVIALCALAIPIPINPLDPVLLAVPFVSSALLYFFPNWVGFVGGVVLMLYLVVAAPAFVRMAAGVPPKTTANAMAWNCFLDVASVFTVAYAFVPFGWLLRERTGFMLMLFTIPLPIALRAAQSLNLPDETRLQQRSRRRIQSVAVCTRYASIAIASAAIVAGIRFRSQSAEVTPPVPYQKDLNIFTGGIFTVHFGIDEPGRDSQRRLASLVKDMEVDVLGMLETDLHRFVYGNRDLTRYMAQELGYYVDLGPGPNKHTWGACLLSKFPIMNSTHHLLPSPAGELAPAIHATIDVRGFPVDVIVSHNGQHEDALDRELQTKELARLLKLDKTRPAIFLGYLVTKQGDEPPWPYGILFDGSFPSHPSSTSPDPNPEGTGLHDIETLDKWRWCEYLGFRGLWRIAYARVHHGDVTDTELQVGKFILPLPNQTASYRDHEEMYWHIGEKDIPVPWRLPAKFRDDSRGDGHYYRVWDGPLYYRPPLDSGVLDYGLGGGFDEWPPRKAEA